MIKKILTNNIGLKLIAILIALIIWFVVVNVSNPEITDTKQITVEVMNDDVLTAIGKTYEFTGSRTITVSYQVRKRDQSQIRSTDFRAYVDLNNIYDITSSVPIVVDVVDHRDMILGDPVAKPTVLHIDVEDIVYRTMNIGINTTGDVKDGYSVGSIAINPTVVQLSGPESEINQIGSVAITIDISGIGEDTMGSAKLLYYDASGKLVNLDDRLESNRTSVDFYISTLGGKSVPVQFATKGQPADGYSLISVDSGIKEVTVMGSKELLDSFSGISVPAEFLDISAATANVSNQIDLTQFVPDGLTVVSDAMTIVTARIAPRNERVFALTWDDITKVGITPDNTYAIDPAIVYVTVGGDQAELNRLLNADLAASLDFTSLGTGIYPGNLALGLPVTYEIKAVTPFNLLVNGGIQTAETLPETSPVETTAETTEQETPPESSAAETETTAETVHEETHPHQTENVQAVE